MPGQNGFAEERSALEGIAADLEHGVDGLQDPASSSPETVDAGRSSGAVSGFLAKVNHMGAGLAQGMSKAGQDARASAQTYDESDANVATDLRSNADQ